MLGAGGTGVAAAKSNPPCPNSADHCKWAIYHVQKLPGIVARSWNDCLTVHAAPLTQHVTCSLAKGTTRTVRADVTGGIELPFAQISASVGYEVGTTTILTATDSVDVPKGKAGKIQYRALFAYKKAVYQRWMQCNGDNHCKDIHNSPPSDFAVAIVDKFDTVDFRFVASPSPRHRRPGRRHR